MSAFGKSSFRNDKVRKWAADRIAKITTTSKLKERFDKKWGVKTKKFRQACRKYLSLDGIVELYEAAVDEEKVAMEWD